MTKTYFTFKNFSVTNSNNLNGTYDDNLLSVNCIQEHEPVGTLDIETGEQKVVTSSSFVIATLKWNTDNLDFSLNSVGMRYLEYATEELNRVLLKFVEFEKERRSLSMSDNL